MDLYLKVDGVPGESVDKDHKDEIEVLSWTWGVEVAVAPRAGKPVPGEFEFAHTYDKSSPKLAKHCVDGKVIKTATLSARRRGSAQKEFLVVTLKEVMITSVQVGAAGSDGITEAVRCAYRDIEFAYKPQDARGALGTPVKFGWDVKNNRTR